MFLSSAEKATAIGTLGPKISFQIILGNCWDSNPGWMGWKRQCYLCAIPSPCRGKTTARETLKILFSLKMMFRISFRFHFLIVLNFLSHVHKPRTGHLRCETDLRIPPPTIFPTPLLPISSELNCLIEMLTIAINLYDYVGLKRVRH